MNNNTAPDKDPNNPQVMFACSEIRAEMGKYRKMPKSEPRFSIELIIVAATLASFAALRLIS